MPHSAYIAVDIGAGSARVLAGCYDGHTLELNEVHRMTNAPLVLPTGEHWNVGGLFEGIVQGLTKARHLYGDTIVSIGIDAFGNGYGLQASDGRLLGLPYHYRDARTEGKMEYAFAQMSERDLFVATGAQSYFFNTLFQVLADLDAQANRNSVTGYRREKRSPYNTTSKSPNTYNKERDGYSQAQEFVF